jgi:hypothetical protein
MDDEPVDWILDCELDVVVDDDEQERVPKSKQGPEDGLVDMLHAWGYEDFVHGHFPDKEEGSDDLLFGRGESVGVDFGVGLGFGLTLSLLFSRDFNHRF